jgi:hypothetical protein
MSSQSDAESIAFQRGYDHARSGDPQPADGAALAAGIAVLEPLNQNSRGRVLAALAAWFAVKDGR